MTHSPRRALGIALLAVLAATGGAALLANASEAPQLSAEIVGDSARVVASWRPGCDDKGCGDSVLVAWQIGERIVKLPRSTSATTDTLWIAVPSWGDSAVVIVRVSTLRRGLVSAPQTDTVVVRQPDAAPPAPDSVKLDTLALREELKRVAELDSFPLVVVRDTAGRSSDEIAAGEAMPLCAFGRNRYTGEVWLLMPWRTPDAQRVQQEEQCERARLLYAAERDG